MKWVGLQTHMQDRKCIYECKGEYLKGRDNLGDLGINEMMINRS
jgi:hypothetical protein